MNSVILDTLTDVELRDDKTLKASVIKNVSAGLPWLTGLDGE